MTQTSRHSDCRLPELTLYHYRELEATERQGLERHLQNCADCRRELAALEATLAWLPREETAVSAAQISAFKARLGERLRPQRRHRLRPALGWSLATASAALLLVTLYAPPQAPHAPQGKGAQQLAAVDQLPEPELLLNMELLQNLDLLQELEGPGGNG